MIRRSANLCLLGLLLTFLLTPPGAGAAGKTAKTSTTKPTPRAGVGLQVVPTATGELVVLGVLPKSPAQKAGLQPGDLIVEVDGAKLQGSRFDEVARKYLWGKAGTKVGVTYLRPGVAGAKQTQLVRTSMPDEGAQNLELRMLEPEQLGEGGKKP